MPVIIDENNMEKWLFSKDTGELAPMLRAAESEKPILLNSISIIAEDNNTLRICLRNAGLYSAWLKK